MEAAAAGLRARSGRGGLRRTPDGDGEPRVRGRFLPEVGDSLNDAGRYPSIVTNPDGLPVVAYFRGSRRSSRPGEVPVDPAGGFPVDPGGPARDGEPAGFWTRGAIAVQAEILNVAIAFNPAFEPVGRGPDPGERHRARDGRRRRHVPRGLGFGRGPVLRDRFLDPATTTQAVVTQVTKTPGYGLSIGLAGGNPAIAFYTSTSSDAKVQLRDAERRHVVERHDRRGRGVRHVPDRRDRRRHAERRVLEGGAGVEVRVERRREQVRELRGRRARGGQGLSGVAMDGGLALSYYDAANGQVTIKPPGNGDGSVDTVGRRRGPRGQRRGTRRQDRDRARRRWFGRASRGWDADEGVRFATGDPGSLKAVDTGTSTVDGTFPSITVNEDGSVTYLAWYATTRGGPARRRVRGLRRTCRSPSPATPTGPIAAPPPSDHGMHRRCVNGTVKVVAQGIAFTEGDCIQADRRRPFSIEFDNQRWRRSTTSRSSAARSRRADTVFSRRPRHRSDQATLRRPGPRRGHPRVQLRGPSDDGRQGRGREGGGGVARRRQRRGGAGGGGQGGSGGQAAAAVARVAAARPRPRTVTASGIAFDTSRSTCRRTSRARSTSSTRTTGPQHNIAIYPSADDLANPLFRGELLTGPGETDYADRRSRRGRTTSN